nr:PEP-CTERM sorting domain-containing protein [uncultured Desulfobacter sp.]
MKKLVYFFVGLFLTFFVVGSASAVSFTDTVIFSDGILAEGSLAKLILDSEYSYTHSTPIDFEAPPDEVVSATLTISGYFIDDNNDTVTIEEIAVGTLNAGGNYDSSWSWDTWSCEIVNDDPSISAFDISGVFQTWEAGTLLDVTITANGNFPDGIIELSSSVFELEYENVTASSSAAAPAPEPATMVLFGLGLLGVAGMSKKKICRIPGR